MREVANPSGAIRPGRTDGAHDPGTVEGGIGDVVEIPGEPDYRVVTVPMDSGIAFLSTGSRGDEDEGRLPIKGRGNLSATRPLGLAYCAERSLLAVSNRSGGSIHLVSIEKGPTSR